LPLLELKVLLLLAELGSLREVVTELLRLEPPLDGELL
jgi:hypothetical protein